MIGRTLVLAFFALLAFCWALVLVSTWNVTASIFGWNLGPDGRTLMYITPGGPAEKAGIRKGDRVDWETLPVLGRANLGIVQAVAPDARLHVTIYRGTATHTYDLTPQPWSAVVVRGTEIDTAAGLILMAMCIGLVYLRPARMTWGFLLSSLVAASPQYVTFWGQTGPWQFLLANGSYAVLSGTAAAGVLMFMSRFPADRARGGLTVLDRAAIPLGVAISALGLFIVLSTLLSPRPPMGANFAYQYLDKTAIALIALGALVVAFTQTKGSDRQRVIPVLISFAFYVAVLMARNIYSALYTEPIGAGTFSVLAAVATLALAGAVAYGVVRHRVIDVSFVISRTLVYTILTSILVGAFALIDFVSSKMLEHFQFTVLIEAFVALAFGIWLNTLHARIDRFVDKVLFRRRHLAEARLDRTGRALLHAESTQFIDEALVIEACDALALTSAAVFRRDGSERYVRVLSRGWEQTHLQSVTSEDHLVVNLLGDLQPLNLGDIRWPHEDVPHGIAQALVALPLCVRHELLGFVLYGGHIGGEAIDPDERRTLTRLTDAAAAAYEHVHAKALVSEASELRAEVTLLNREQRLLRETIDTLAARSAP